MVISRVPIAIAKEVATTHTVGQEVNSNNTAKLAAKRSKPIDKPRFFITPLNYTVGGTGGGVCCSNDANEGTCCSGVQLAIP